MPARSKVQLRYAFAHKRQKWAKELISKTHTTRGLPQRVKKGKK